MLYYYVDSSGQTAGPVEPEALHNAIHDGALLPQTLAVEEGGSEWKPLSALLKYFYSTGGEVLGPVRLADLPALSATGAPDFMMMPEGGSEWLPRAAVLRQPPPIPVVVQSYTVANAVPASAPAQRSPRSPRRSMPATAKAAGILWIIFGTGKMLECVVALNSLSKVRGGINGIVLGGWIFYVLIGLIFIRAGVMTCYGTARDTRGNGVGSIGLGILAFCFAKQQSVLLREPIDPWMCAGGIILLSAGVLALNALKPYREWKTGRPSRIRQ